MRSSLRSVALNGTSLIRPSMSRASIGTSGRVTGLIWTRTTSCASHPVTSGVIVGFPAKPPSR